MRYGIVLLMFACLASMAPAAEPSIAVVDMEELVRLHPNTASDKKLLERTLKEFNAEKESLKSRAEEARKAFESAVKAAQDPALADAARKGKEGEAMRCRETAIAAEREFNEKMRQMQNQLTEQEVRMLKRTSEEIDEVVSAYAKEKSLQLVLQLPGRKMATASSVLYAVPSLDITPAIMKRMGIKPDADSAVEGGRSAAPKTPAVAPAVKP